MEDYKDQRKKAIKKTIFTYLTITVIGAVLAGIGMLLRGKAEGFGIVMGLIGLIFVGVGVLRGAAKYKESNDYSVRNAGMLIQSSVRNHRGANRTTEKKYMLTKRLIVHAKIAEMKRASQKNFL